MYCSSCVFHPSFIISFGFLLFPCLLMVSSLREREGGRKWLICANLPIINVQNREAEISFKSFLDGQNIHLFLRSSFFLFLIFLVACARLYNPLFPLAHRSVHRSVTLSFFGAYRRLSHYCSCQIVWSAIFISAPAHPHATKIAVYTALFMFCFLFI